MTTMDISPTTSVRTRATHHRIPLGRIVSTELRKMFDTRSGFWLMASIAILAFLTTAAVVLWASSDELTYSQFATAINTPTRLVLPIIAILSVTGEWSQRSGLTTFTLVPHRGRVIGAKAIACVGVALVATPLAFGIGALGNVVGTTILGVDTVWDLAFTDLLNRVLVNVLGLLVGFMLGVLIRTSAGAITAYFIYAFLLPSLALLLATTQDWFHDLQPWVDFYYAQQTLLDGTLTSQQWSHLAVTGVVWLVIPLTLGLFSVTRVEVK